MILLALFTAGIVQLSPQETPKDAPQFYFRNSFLALGLLEKAYDFCCRRAGIKNPLPTETYPGEINMQELYSSPDGWVMNLPGEKALHDFIVERAAKQKAARKKYSKEEIRTVLKNKLGIGDVTVPDYRILRVQLLDEATLNWNSRFALETEKDMVMCVLHRRSKEMIYHIEDARSVNLYIPHIDTRKELGMRRDSDDSFLYGLDYRGVGECTPTSCSPWCSFFDQYEYDFHFAGLGEMTGLSYLGGRVKDILSAVELLALNCPDIHLEARGQGTIPALIAAVLSDKIKTINLIDPPESWESMAVSTVPDAEKSARACMIEGILKEFDLEDLKKLVVIRN